MVNPVVVDQHVHEIAGMRPVDLRDINPCRTLDLFRHACRMGLEGLVSKHRERVYRPGRCDHWLKVKNRKHPAYSRVLDQLG